MMSFMLIFLWGILASGSTVQEQTVTQPTPDGYKTRKCEFPNMAILKIHTSNGFKICAGSLVSLKNVVSSAQCIPADLKYVEVFLGGSSLDQMQQRILVNGSAIHIHPQYKQPLTKSQLPLNDVAFVTLPEPVKVNHCIQPIELATDADAFYPLCTIAGWENSLEPARMMKDLQWENLALISEDECRTVVPHLRHDQICGQAMRKENNQMCQTDIGSALMCWRVFDDHLVLVGVSSSDVGCDYGLKVFTQLSNSLSYDDDDDDGDDDNYSNDDDEKKTTFKSQLKGIVNHNGL